MTQQQNSEILKPKISPNSSFNPELHILMVVINLFVVTLLQWIVGSTYLVSGSIKCFTRFYLATVHTGLTQPIQ